MAVTTPKMGLKVWNLETDSYDHSQLAENWAKVDQHNHSEGEGSPIPTGGIENGAISESKIGNGQVSPEKLTGSVLESVGINSPAATYRGFSTTVSTYTNSTTSYTLVDSVTVTTQIGARLMISYLALYKAGTASANIACLVDGVEAKRITTNGAPVAYVSPSLEVASFFGSVMTAPSGTAAFTFTKGETSDTFYNSTGMGAPGTLTLFNLPAGSHKVEIKAKAGASGKIELSNRFLWVRSEGYA